MSSHSFFEASHVSNDAVVTCLEGDSLLPPWHPAVTTERRMSVPWEVYAHREEQTAP